jgi:hypothetical protein
VAFVTAQGVPNKFGRNRRSLDIHAIDALQRYLALQTATSSDRHSVIAV